MSSVSPADFETAGGPLLSPSRVGDVNRSRILQTLVDHGPLSRADLAKAANVTRATIGNIVNSLVDAGVLEEQDPRTGTIGKPARPLWFASGAALSLVLAIDEDHCTAALADARGELWSQTTVRYSRSRPSRQQLIRTIDRAVAAVDENPSTKGIIGIGVSVPGLCDPSEGEVLNSTVVPALAGRWLHDRLSDRYGVSVVIDNDSRSQALAEKWFGLARGLTTSASVQAGRNIGVGIVQNGVIFRVEGGRGPEFGHTVVDLHGEPCRCGRVGCWETVAGSDWIRREASRQGWRDADKLDIATLVEQAEENPEAAALLERYADHLAVGLTNIMHVYLPQRFILHGEVVQGGERLRALIEEATRRRVVDLVQDDVEVVLSDLDQLATLMGAAALVLSHRFDLAI